ncbi:MAG: hypothetical protein ABI051_11400 [Vicinamibacterales bacterium]
MSFQSRRLIASAFLCVAVACGKSPVSPGGSPTTPGLSSPPNGALIANTAQPVTLTVTNATATSGTVSYTFEVANDSTFATVVLTKEVPQGAGETSVKLDVLPAGREYYWRARTKIGDAVGTFTAPVRFTIGAAVTISTPVPILPLSGASSDQRPRLAVSNVSSNGPAGPLSYRFEISTSAAFSPVLASGTVSEGNGSTSFTPGTDLPADAAFFWRAQVVDPASGATSPYSAPQSFSTALAVDLNKVNYQRFVNISGWPVTNRVISVDQDGGDGHMCIDHEKRGQLPTVNFEDNPLVPVEATQWYFARINGQWYAGAGEWLRPNQICKDGQKSEDIGKDGTWGGPMDTWIPKRGELVGYLISTPARSWPSQTTIDQRSNVVVRPWVVNGISTP